MSDATLVMYAVGVFAALFTGYWIGRAPDAPLPDDWHSHVQSALWVSRRKR